MHFKDEFDEKLKTMKIKHVWAFSYHFSSVRLTKRCVQVILSQLRVLMQHSAEFILKWNWFIKSAVNATNTRMIRTQRYTSSQLLFEFESKHFRGMKQLNDALQVKFMKSNIMKMSKEDLELSDAVYEVRMMTMNEIRNLALERWLRDQETLYNKANSRFFSSQKENLVLVRRQTQDNQHDHKLKARWNDSQRLMRMTTHERSIWVTSLHFKMSVRKFHINDVKIFMPWNERTSDDEDWKSIFEINDRIRILVKEWIKKHREEKKSRNVTEIKVSDVTLNAKTDETKILNRDSEHEDLFKQDIEEWWDEKYFITTSSKKNDDYWLFRAVNLTTSY